MLKKTRTVLAAICFVLITLLFLDFTGTLHAWLGWVAKIQFLPALMALNFVVVACLVVLTLMFGRVYCSVICPLGVMQDVVSHVSGCRKKKKHRFSYSPAKNWLRYGFLLIFVVAFVAGAGSVVALLAPYSSYGRIVQNLLQTVWIGANNVLAYLAERLDSYAFYSRDIWIRSISTFAIAAATLVVVGVLAWRNGRTYCNTVCPVGTVLGFLSRFSWLKVRFDGDKCRSCGMCSRTCKASCIDFKSKTVDYSRCVTCGDCLEQCKFGALRYGAAKKTDKPAVGDNRGGDTPDASRRAAMLGAVALATTAVMSQTKKKVDGGLAAIEDKVVPERQTPIVPPGAVSAAHMARHCTACQLCVAVCPNDVLRPSDDPLKLMQPTMSYERGYCRPECTKCSEVCPAGAILPITRAEKSSVQIGHAVWVKKNCIPLTDGVACGNCAKHCPVGAIIMVPMPKGDGIVRVPSVNVERCIGCGTCENLCPARPLSAIYVEGNEVHRVI